MTSKLLYTGLVVLTVSSLLLALMGLFHIVIYLFDDRPLFEGVRYLNWLIAVPSAIVFGLCYARLVRK
ncbi:MAG: hypothetical protein AAGI23_08140 [Bacteroidota bacterium]